MDDLNTQPAKFKYDRVAYEGLNSRQQEAFNFQKVSAVLADYGFITLRLSSDWEGADFIAQHCSGDFLKVQLKGRLTFSKKYTGKDLHVAFPHDGDWYVYPHDAILSQVLEETKMGETEAWQQTGIYSYPGLSRTMRDRLEPYRLGVKTSAGDDKVEP